MPRPLHKPSIERDAQETTNSEVDVHDLCIKSLPRVEGPTVRWIESYVDHLKLDLEGNGMILKVCWSVYLPCFSTVLLETEIEDLSPVNA
jgi:hypothetical protein